MKENATIKCVIKMVFQLIVLGKPLKSNLSKVVVVVTWLFVVPVLNSVFTASLTSILTVSKLKHNAEDIQSLKESGAIVGWTVEW